MCTTKLLLIFVVITLTNGRNRGPLVEISSGWVRGTLQKSYEGREFACFEGIPYAKPPTGKLRFEPPQKPHNWTGVWMANTKIECLQSQFDGSVIGSENCLHLNVYVPRTQPNSSDNLDVIVHIHAGAFMWFSPHRYAGPKYLMDEETVFVTMNYRLGPFGFLSTGDRIVPGNNGMKDQVFALQWIKENIKHFGGNPDSVTITGMSAGAGSVHLHYFSPLSKGLFHKGVSQSGTAVNAWAIQENLPERSKILALEIGCPTNTTGDMVHCLRSRHPQQIIEGMRALYKIGTFPAVLFGPVIEDKDVRGAFLTEDPHKMLTEGRVLDVPWVCGVTKEEGEFMANVFVEGPSQLLENFDENAQYFLEVGKGIREEIVQKVKQRYVKNSDTHEGLIRMLSERYFNTGAGVAAKLQAKVNQSPVYFYRFGYKGRNDFTSFFVKDAHIDVSHGDDIFYYLHSPLAEDTLSETDNQMKNVFLQWLISYASTGEPRIDGACWNPVSGKDVLESLYFEGPEKLRMEKLQDFGSYSFWNELGLD